METPFVANDAEDLRNALGLGTPYIYRGREYDLRPLDLFDMMELMGKFGGMSRIDLVGDPAAILYTVWLVLRRADPDLTPADRRARRWRMALDDAAALFSLDNPVGTLEFLSAIKDVSGLLGNKDPEEAEQNESKNSPAATRSKRPRATRGAAS